MTASQKGLSSGTFAMVTTLCYLASGLGVIWLYRIVLAPFGALLCAAACVLTAPLAVWAACWLRRDSIRRYPQASRLLSAAIGVAMVVVAAPILTVLAVLGLGLLAGLVAGAQP